MPQKKYEEKTNNTSISEIKSERNEFDKMLAESVLSGLNNLLGEGGAHAILFHLQLQQMLKDYNAFHESLYKIFKEGTTVVEKIIIKDAYARAGLVYKPSEEFNFVEEVNHLMFIISRNLMRGVKNAGK